MAGASPEIMASAVATPLEREFGRIADVTEMTSQSTLGQTGVTLQFALSRISSTRRPGRGVGDQRGAKQPADKSSEQSDVQEGESRRRPHNDHRAHLGQAGPLRALRRRLNDPRAEAVPDPGGRTGHCRRELVARSADRRQSNPAERLRAAAGGRPHGGGRADRERGQGRVFQPDPALDDRAQRPADEGGRLPAGHHQVQQRRAGAAVGRRDGHRLRCRRSARSAS